MSSFASLFPSFVLFCLIFLVRVPSHTAGFIASLLSMIVLLMREGSKSTIDLTYSVLLDTTIISSSVAFVIIPGFLFANLLRDDGFEDNIKSWIVDSKLSRVDVVVLIMYGLAPVLEGITGFGISLIVTAPIFLCVFNRNQSLRISMLTMMVMPWGILGLPTIIGATIAKIDPSELGRMSALTSSLVIEFFCILALLICENKSSRLHVFAISISTVFCALIYGINKLVGPSLACAGSGIIVTAALLIVYRIGNKNVKLPIFIWPFAAVALIIAAMIFISSNITISKEILLHGDQANWAPFSSPGIPLILVSLLFVSKKSIKKTYFQVMSRAKRPMLTITSLLLFSQIMAKGHFFIEIERHVAEAPTLMLPWLVAVSGGISGYITGSTVGGNALLMSTIPNIGHNSAQELWLAAIQNSSAGVGALSSVSVIAIISGLSEASESEEHGMLLFGFVLLIINIVLISVAGTIVVYTL